MNIHNRGKTFSHEISFSRIFKFHIAVTDYKESILYQSLYCYVQYCTVYNSERKIVRGVLKYVLYTLNNPRVILCTPQWTKPFVQYSIIAFLIISVGHSILGPNHSWNLPILYHAWYRLHTVKYMCTVQT